MFAVFHISHFVFCNSQHLEEHNLFPIHLAAIYLLWYLMHANDPTLIQLSRNGSSPSHQYAITKNNLTIAYIRFIPNFSNFYTDKIFGLKS